jgi:hypothetical protein
MNKLIHASLVCGLFFSHCFAQTATTKHASFTALAPVSFDHMVDRVVQSERAFVATMKTIHPLAETYIQNLRQDKDHKVEPTSTLRQMQSRSRQQRSLIGKTRLCPALARS